jgi:hypothetical protein
VVTPLTGPYRQFPTTTGNPADSRNSACSPHGNKRCFPFAQTLRRGASRHPSIHFSGASGVLFGFHMGSEGDVSEMFHTVAPVLPFTYVFGRQTGMLVFSIGLIRV